MPLNARDLWLFLRAQNMADRELSKFAKDIDRAGNAVRLAQLEAEKATAQAELGQRKMNETLAKAELRQIEHEKALAKTLLTMRQVQEQQKKLEIATLSNEKAVLRNQLAMARLAGAQKEVKRELQFAIIAVEKKITANNKELISNQKLTNDYRELIDTINMTVDQKKKDILMTQKQTNATRQRLLELDKEIKITKDIDKNLKLTDELRKLGERGSNTFFRSLFKPSPSLLSALRSGIPGVLASPIGASALILGALWAVSFVSAVISSAALGLIATGIIAMGAVALRENEKIKAAFERTGQFISKSFAKVAAPMIPSFLNAMEIIRTGLKEKVLPEVAKIVVGAGNLVTTIAAMAVSAVTEILKPMAEPRALQGLREFIINIQPHVRRLGMFIGEFFAMLMQNGPLIAKAFGVAVSIIGNALKAVGALLILFSGTLLAFADVWNKTWAGVKKVIIEAADALGPLGGALKPVAEKLKKSAEGSFELQTRFEELDPKTQDLIRSFINMDSRLNFVNKTTTTTIRKFDEVTQKTQSLFSKFMSLDESTANVASTILGLKDALDKNGKSLNLNTVAGAQNRTALLNAVSAAEAHRKKMIENGLSVAHANDIYRQNIDKIFAMAEAFGIDKKALEQFLAKYRDLARAGNIHKKITITGEKIGSDIVFKIAGTNLKFAEKGGRLAAKQASIVGEKGPELFVPDRAGLVISNQKWMKNGKVMEKWFRNPMVATPNSAMMPWFMNGGTAPRQTQNMAPKMINITQNITTQEIDPRVHSSQLGWELAGRLG